MVHLVKKIVHWPKKYKGMFSQKKIKKSSISLKLEIELIGSGEIYRMEVDKNKNQN